MTNTKQHKSNKAVNTISGMNIFKDNKGRFVYLDRFSKTGYIVPVESMKQYRYYSMRFFLSIAIFVLLADYILAPWLAAVITLIVYALMEYRFRKKFLASLTQVPNFTPALHQSRMEAMASGDTSKIILRIVLFLALAILLVLNVWDQANRGYEIQGMTLTLSYVLSACSVIVSLMYGYALIIKKK